jgi:molecular chaperone DnaJ
LSVKVPGGVDDGTRIQLSGEGEVGPGGGPAGDLYVEVAVQPHPVFTRQRDDLHCTLAVPMSAAALGSTVTLDTLDGPRSVDIRPGTQAGTVVTLRDLGVSHLRGGGRGDLHVHIDVQTPTRLDDRQRELLAELARLRGEERPAGTLTESGSGLFSKLRDAFKG